MNSIQQAATLAILLAAACTSPTLAPEAESLK